VDWSVSSDPPLEINGYEQHNGSVQDLDITS
jgi:hypothetical protein